VAAPLVPCAGQGAAERLPCAPVVVKLDQNLEGMLGAKIVRARGIPMPSLPEFAVTPLLSFDDLCQQLQASKDPCVFCYDRLAPADLLQKCHDLVDRNVIKSAICFIPAGQQKPWQSWLKGLHLLTQLPARTVLGHFCDGKPCKASCNLNVWMIDQPSGAPVVETTLPSAVPNVKVPGTSHKMQFAVHLAGASAIALVDSGAEAGPYISKSFVTLHGLRIIPAPTVTVRGVCGVEGGVVGQVSVCMKIGPVRMMLNCTVVDMVAEFDLLLSDSWLHEHKAIIDFGERTCALWHKGQLRVLRATESPDSQPKPVKPVLSYVQLRRLAKQRVEYCLLLVNKVPETDSVPAAEYNSNLMTTDQVQRIIGDYPMVFTDEAPPGGSKIQCDFEVIETTTPKPVSRPLFRYSPVEMAEMERQVADLLARGYITPSTSPYGAPVLFVKKPRSTELRMCVDFRALNAVTVKNAGPLPRIDDMLSLLAGARVFSALDLRSAYNQVQLQPSDCMKTAFKTPFGLFEYKTLCFGLTNAPAAFQSVMNSIFRPYLNSFVMVYLDDILIFSKTPEEHERHLRLVLDVLRNHNLTAAVHKCTLNQPQILYLGHVVSAAGVAADPAKTKAVAEFPRPRDVHQLRSFLGMCNYFRRFIHKYAAMVRPLTNLLKSGVNVAAAWSQEATAAFEAVKRALSSAPVLRLPDWRSDQPFDLYCDASYAGVGGALLQDGHPVAYESRKLIPAEMNYPPTEIEMLAVVHCCKMFRCYIEGKRVRVHTDHKPNTSFASQFMPSRRQARWIDLLQGYNLEWHYTPGKSNFTDPLSRNPVVGVIQRGKKSVSDPDFLSRVRAGYLCDPWFAVDAHKQMMHVDDGLFYHQGALVLPADPELINEVLLECHSTPYSGHPGRERTLKLVRRHFWWPSMASSVKQFVLHCDACQRNKASNLMPGGLLRPLGIPGTPWQSISMDFVTQLPVTATGFTAILVCVDRLTKMVRLAPCHDTSTAEDVARIFLDRVFANHGLPEEIVSDRDAKFTSRFWEALCDELHMVQSKSTAFHPQSDGNTERVNRVMEDMLRHVVIADHSTWDKHLSLVEFAINNAHHESIQSTPFMLNYGRHPETPISRKIKRDAERSVNALKHAARTTPCKVPAVAEFVSHMESLVARAKTALEAAQQRQKAYADRKRRLVTFAVGDKVLLNTKHLSLKMPGASKLYPKFVGPFLVVQKVNDVAFKLELPPSMHVHNVFHVSLLKQYQEDPNTSPPPPPEVIDGNLEFTVERVLAHRDKRVGRRTTREYLIRWLGYGPEHDSWEPLAMLDNAAESISDYLADVEAKAGAVVPGRRKRKRVDLVPAVGKRKR